MQNFESAEKKYFKKTYRTIYVFIETVQITSALTNSKSLKYPYVVVFYSCCINCPFMFTDEHKKKCQKGTGSMKQR